MAELRPRFFVGAALTLAAVALVLALLVRAHEVIFLAFVAVVLATALDVPVRHLARHIPRGLATILVLVLATAVAATVIVLAAPRIASQGQDLAKQLPAALTRLSTLQRRWLGASRGSAGGAIPAMLSGAEQALGKAIPVVGGIAETAGAFVAVVFMAGFLCWQPRVYLDGVLRLVPPSRRDAANEFLHRVHPVLQEWMLGTLMSMTVMGVLAAIGLKLLGVDAWLFLGALTFAAEFVPYIGPIIAGVTATLFGLASSGTLALKVLILFTILQQLEGHTLLPFLMRKTVRLRPALLIAWQLAVAAAFGIYGLLVATPALAVLKVAVEYFYLERTLGEPA